MSNDYILSDSRTLIQDAQDDFIQLREEIAAFVNRRPYTKIQVPDIDPGWVTVKLRAEDPPKHWNKVARHIIWDMRASLDQAVFAVAQAWRRAMGAKLSEPKRIRFPFATSESDLDGQIKRDLHDVPPAVLAVIRRAAPYIGGDETFWSLNKLANSHKHRFIVPFARNLAGGARLLIPVAIGCITAGPLLRQARNPEWNPDTNELELYSMREGTVAPIEFGRIDFGVVIGDFPRIAGHRALDVLWYIGRKTDAILKAIEDEARCAWLTPR